VDWVIGLKTRTDRFEDGGSLAGRLLALLSVPLGALLLIALLFHYLGIVGPEREAADQSLADLALVYGASVREGEAGGAVVRLSPSTQAVFSRRLGSAPLYVLRDANGRTLDGDDRLPALGSTNQVVTLAVPPLGTFRLTAIDGRTGGLAWRLVMGQDIRSTRSTGGRLTATLVLDVLQLCAALTLLWLGVRRGLRPLTQLRDTLMRRSARDLEPMDVENLPNELKPLVAALNGLFERLSSAAESQRKFVADAAHQLRTPLAGIRAQLELLAAESEAIDFRARIGSVQAGVERLSHTAHQLLALAQADAAHGRNAGDVRLETLLGDAVAAEVDRALAAGIDLGADLQAVSVRGYDWHLRELVANLLDNALSYVPRGGTVTVRCGRDGTGAYLEVEDDGPGIPPEHRHRVVERFYRVPGAPGTGSGLGLAIVADVVALHGGRLEITERLGGAGTRVRVRFTA
jgi:two-component system, OmpR family, sensor histidine kinase TctE